MALIATVAAFALNVMWALSQTSWKLDPGTATLSGAIIGLAYIGAQARKGFANLIKSQRSQSELDRDARLHRFELERAGNQADEARDKRLLLSGLRAEIVALMSNAVVYADAHKQFAIIYKAIHEHGGPPTITEFSFAGYKPLFYRENIGKLGLLGVSLAADVIKAYSMANEERKVVWATAAPNSVVSVAYATSAVSNYKFNADLYHVAMRIRSIEEGTADPGTLTATEAARHASLPKFEDMVPKKMV